MGEDRTGRYGASEPPTDQRLSVRQAAARLGISEGAVRSRIKRGTLRTEKLGDRVYVVFGGDEPTGEPTGQPDRTAELIATLREQLQAEREANRENRRIIAALTQRIPELEAPRETTSESPEAPTGATEQPGRVEPQPQVEGEQEGTERVSWWQRWFGGA